MKSRLGPIALAPIALALTFVASCTEPQPAADPVVEEPPTRLLLVRHAEKEDSSFNPNLTAEGGERAQRLADVAEAEGVEAIYTTEFCRTALTAQPAALRLGLPLRVDSNGVEGDDLAACTPEVTADRVDHPEGRDAPAFVTDILAAHAGQTVLIAGHSNTVPDLVAALTGGSPCPEIIPGLEDGRCFIADEEFGLLFDLSVPADGSPPELSLGRY